MTATILPNAKTQFFDGNGKPLAGGTVYFFIPNTSTPKATWQDPAQTILNTQPVVLDASGEALIWGSGTYRQVVNDVNGNLIWDQITQDANAGLTGNITDKRYVAGTDFTPGTTTQLTLPVAPGAVSNMWVFFDAAFQADDQFSVSGATLTFNTPIPVGVQEVNVKIGTTVAIGTPGNGTVGDSQLAWGSTLTRVFASIAALRSAGSQYTNAFVQSYYGDDANYQGFYKVKASDTTSADNGGSIIVDSIGRRWYLNSDPDWYVEQFGAKGDGVTDDTVAINAAIAALPNRGGTVRLRGKTYMISASITVGNGNGGSTPSTKNGVRLIGCGSGKGPGNPPPTLIQAIDNGAASPYLDTMLLIQGAIDSCYFEGFRLYGLGANSTPTTGSLINNGIFCNGGVTASTFKNISIAFHTTAGLRILAGGAPTGNYNIYNEFHQIDAISSINGHNGLLMDGVFAVSNDTWLTSFYNCRFDTFTAINAIAGDFKFVDSCSFYRCHFVGNNTGGVPLTNCFGAYFNAVGNNGFPSGMCFHDCSILTTFVNEVGGDHIRVNTFINYGTADNETIPTHPSLKGITDQGNPFNGWGT
jgi:hypothetical protein